MDSPARIRSTGKPPDVLSPCGSIRRRSSSASNSPEFEFWRLTNPSFQPEPDLVSADELFVDGVLVPLHLLSKSVHPSVLDASKSEPDPAAPLAPETAHQPEEGPAPEPGPGPELTRETAVSGFTASKRWRDIFRKSESKPPAKSREDKEKDKENRKKEKRSQTGSSSGTSTTAELNINIWPFSRSRSAGNSVTRPRMSFGAPVSRKVSSAPCSRSNSAGESKSRKWPNSPGRGGVHLGRSSPVWQVRRGVPTGKPISELRNSGERGVGKRVNTEARKEERVNEKNKAKVLNLNVPMCIGYRSRLSCRSEESGNSNSQSGSSSIGSGNSNPNANSLFGFRNLFIKKVH